MCNILRFVKMLKLNSIVSFNLYEAAAEGA